jgi:benzoate membrane transport protein
VSRQAIFAGILAAFVGFASSFAVVLKGLTAVGASPAQAASGLMALAIAMGVCAILLSLWRREPISIAWSTPGGALLSSSAMPDGGFPVAVGAFLLSGALIVLAGLWRPLGRAVAAIPSSLANAMLAGVLLSLCLAPMRAIAVTPAIALPVILTWAVVWRFWRLYAVPAAVLLMVVLLAFQGTAAEHVRWLAEPVIVMPVWSTAAMIGLALPLFLVTMASQNIPGMAVLAVNGYRPPAGALFQVTGLFTLFAAPFGGHAVNLAAITAALCAGPDAHPDPTKRYWAAVVAGATYVCFGLLAGAATSLITASPPILIEAIAGLALLGALGGALMGAVNDAEGRKAAVITFLVTASGLSFFGISGAFWGLLAGGAMRALMKWRANTGQRGLG